MVQCLNEMTERYLQNTNVALHLPTRFIVDNVVALGSMMVLNFQRCIPKSLQLAKTSSGLVTHALMDFHVNKITFLEE